MVLYDAQYIHKSTQPGFCNLRLLYTGVTDEGANAFQALPDVGPLLENWSTPKQEYRISAKKSLT